MTDDLRDSTDVQSDPDELRRRVTSDGYVFIRGLIEPDLVEAAQREAFDSLAQAGWLGVGPDGRPGEIAQPLRDTEPGRAINDAGLRSVLGSASFNRLPYGSAVQSTMRAVLGDDAFCYPVKVFRVVYPAALVAAHPGNVIHQDFTVTGVQDMFTMWTPLMNISRTLGGLCVRTGSHNEGLLRSHPVFDPNGATRWATTDFDMGDVLIFHCLTAHAALPNGTDGLRLSGEFRWQKASDPVPRFLVTGSGTGDSEMMAGRFSATDWWKAVPDGLELIDTGTRPEITELPRSRFAGVPGTPAGRP